MAYNSRATKGGPLTRYRHVSRGALAGPGRCPTLANLDGLPPADSMGDRSGEGSRSTKIPLRYQR
jgi:hypothetical protein